MRRTSILVLGPAVLAALALVAAGCGGGGKKSAASTTTEAASTAAATTEAATTTEAVTTEPTTTEATSVPNLSAFASKNCRKLAEVSSKFSQAFGNASKNQDLKTEADLLSKFASEAPSDIKGDFKVIADFFSKYVAALGNVKAGATPTPEQAAKLQKFLSSLESQKLQTAGQHITAWVTKNCHA